MSFYIGQKVVCVDDRIPKNRREYHSAMPKKGCVYVVREVVIIRNKTGLNLIGIQSATHPSGSPFSFKAWRFRPLDDMKEEASNRQQEEAPCKI